MVKRYAVLLYPSSSAAISAVAPALLRQSSWAVADAILTPGPGDQAGALPAGCLQVLAVAQAFPDTRHFELGPPFVVLVIALVWTSPEVRRALWGNQQTANGCRGSFASVSLPVITERAVRLAQLVVGHAPHDGATRHGEAARL
jgi:hypothetical protein